MSIKNLAFQLCKGVKKTPNRDLIRNLLLGLQFGVYSRFNLTVRDTFKSPKLQFFAYLLVNGHSENFETKHGARLTKLDDDDIDLLANCHGQLEKLLTACLRPLIEELPNSTLAVNSYKEYDFSPEIKDLDFQLFSFDDAVLLAAEFTKHEAILNAINAFKSLNENIEEDHFFSDVKQYTKEFLDSTPFGSPGWIRELLQTKDLARANHVKLMLNLVSLRDSINNLNQLIFQAVCNDSLLMLDEDNLIDLGPTHRGSISAGITATCLTSPIWSLTMQDPLFNIGNLILLKGVYGSEKTALGRVERSKGTFMAGGPATLDIRLLDENLSTFSTFQI